MYLGQYGKRYDIDPEVKASGTYGDIYYGTDTDGKEVAIKVMKLNEDTFKIKDIYENYLSNYVKCNLSNVSCLIDIIRTRDSKYGLVFDRMDGDLENYFEINKRPSPPQINSIICQTLWGLSSIHMVGFAHQDIKPANILTKRLEDGSTYAEISDLDTICSEIFLRPCYTHATRNYIPPEWEENMRIYGNNGYWQYAEDKYSAMLGDSWALGASYYYLLTGRHLWDVLRLKNKLGNRYRNFDLNELLQDYEPVYKTAVYVIKELCSTKGTRKLPLEVYMKLRQNPPADLAGCDNEIAMNSFLLVSLIYSFIMAGNKPFHEILNEATAIKEEFGINLSEEGARRQIETRGWLMDEVSWNNFLDIIRFLG